MIRELLYDKLRSYSACLTRPIVCVFFFFGGLEAKVPLIFTTCILLVLSLVAVWGGLVLPFTEDTARAVNVSN